MEANHLLHYKPGDQGYGQWRLECLPGKPHGSFVEADWRTSLDCRCTDPTCPCRMGDHSGCSEFGLWIEGIETWECRCNRDESECWTVGWFDEQGIECLDGDDWPEDVLPLPVQCSYEDGLRIRYCPAADS